MKDFAIKAENLTKVFYRSKKTSALHAFSSHRSHPGEENLIYALNDISFTLNKGQALGIIGNNGAGKSTLLKILAGITRPTAGKVLVNGNISAFLDMGAALNPELSGRENIFIYGELQGISPATLRKYYSSIVEFSELGEYIDTPVKHYSAGMTVRLAFSIVAHSEKDILLFDEAFEVGDVFFRMKCQKLFYELRNQHKTILLVSHNLNEIAGFCDRLLLLHCGKIITTGHPEKVIKQYNDFHSKDGAHTKSILSLYNLSHQLQSDFQNEITWDEDLAPSDNGCKILSVKISSDAADDEEGKSLQIRIKTKEFKGDIAFSVSDFLDYKLFGDLTSNHPIHISDGEFELHWKLPLNVLNNGWYKVSVFILDEEKFPAYRLFDILAFRIEHKNDKETGFYTPLRPDLQFSINKLSE